jgi:hypothetical protein
MIAYIKESIKWAITEDIARIFDEFSIYYNETHILPQKITVNEVDMNYLFSEVFLGNVDIEYGFYGGSGCEFSIVISEKLNN